MRKRRKNPIARRLIITLIAFLAVLAVLLTAAAFQPLEDPEKTESDASSDTVSETTDRYTEDVEPVADAQAFKSTAEQLLSAGNFSARHFAIYDITTGQTVFEKNATDRITAASTIKLLTALTMLDHVSAEEQFTVGNEISLIGSGSSTAKLKKGFVMNTEQILDALLIPSGNDAAYVIAAHVGRKLSGDPQITDSDAVSLFLEKMNEKAKALGAMNSNFTCPDGYPNKTQYTTAADMLKISVAAAQNETIRKTTGKTFVSYTMHDGTVLKYTNTNQLIVPSNKNFYEGLFGMKTGTTNAAGQCLIAGCDIYGHKIIIALFQSTDRWADCQKIIDLTTSAITQNLPK